MCIQQYHCRGNESLTAAIAAFIGEHGDVALTLPVKTEINWNEFIVKGTGSPPKNKHGPRGPPSLPK